MYGCEGPKFTLLLGAKEGWTLFEGHAWAGGVFEETPEPDPPVWGLPTVATFLKNQKTLPVDFLVPAACQQPQVTLVLLTPSQGSGPSPSQGQVCVTGYGCMCECECVCVQVGWNHSPHVILSQAACWFGLEYEILQATQVLSSISCPGNGHSRDGDHTGLSPTGP